MGEAEPGGLREMRWREGGWNDCDLTSSLLHKGGRWLALNSLCLCCLYPGLDVPPFFKCQGHSLRMQRAFAYCLRDVKANSDLGPSPVAGLMN